MAYNTQQQGHRQMTRYPVSNLKFNTVRGVIPSAKRSQHSSLHHRCRWCVRCERAARIQRANSCPPQLFLNLSYSSGEDINSPTPPPPSLIRWREEVQPGTPTPSVPPSEKWQDFDYDNFDYDDFDEMSERLSQTGSRASSAYKINSHQYSTILSCNRIYMGAALEPRPTLPEWVTALREKIKKFRIDTSENNWWYNSQANTVLREINTISFMNERSFESALTGALPLDCIGYRNYLSASTLIKSSLGRENSPLEVERWARITKVSHDQPRDATIHTRVTTNFPCPQHIKCGGPDEASGYSPNFLAEVFPHQVEKAMEIQERYSFNSESLLFPYLFTEFKTGENGGEEAANNQLLTSCAIALSITKGLIKTGNVVYGLSIIGKTVVLYAMWMAGTLEHTQFIMSPVWYTRLEEEENVFQFMSVLIYIHEWARFERAAEITAALEDKESATDGTLRPPVILAPAIAVYSPFERADSSSTIEAARRQQRTTSSNDLGIGGSTGGRNRRGEGSTSSTRGADSTLNAATNRTSRDTSNKGNRQATAFTRRLRSAGLKDN